jgi:predicted transcriptional regulator
MTLDEAIKAKADALSTMLASQYMNVATNEMRIAYETLRIDTQIKFNRAEAVIAAHIAKESLQHQTDNNNQ